MKDEVKIILDICDKILLKNVDHHLRLNLEPNSTQFKTLKDEIISSELTKLLVKEDLGGAGMTLAAQHIYSASPMSNASVQGSTSNASPLHT